MHDIRYIPQGGALVEVTTVTLQNRHLLRPSATLNDLVVGVLAHAQAKHEVEIIALAFLSTHYHLLLFVNDAQQLAKFMRLVNANLSKEVGRLHDWKGPMWKDRYRMIPVSEEPEAQIARLEYCLAQGVKEHLVAKAIDWPGVHASRALILGERLEGHWIDRTAEYEARRRKDGHSVDAKDFATEVEIRLSPLPCWRHLPETTRRRRVEEMLERIEAAAEQERRTSGRGILGRRRILRTNPHQRGEVKEKRVRPRFHAATKKARKTLETTYRAITQAYRVAAGRLKAGALSCAFPPGTFPPARPFVAFKPS